MNEYARDKAGDDQVAKHVAEIAINGFTIIPNVFNPGRASALRDKLDQLESELRIESGKNRFEGTSTRRIYNLLAHGGLFEQIAVDPKVLPLVERVLEGEPQVS